VRPSRRAAIDVKGTVCESALLYVSERASADAGDLGRIVEVSRRRNERDRITGLLMFDGRHFAQWIEGPCDAMDDLLQRLRADPRHREVQVLWFESPGLGRRFPNWAFAHLGLEPGAGAIARLRSTRGADAMLAFGDLIREAALAHRWPQPKTVPVAARRDGPAGGAWQPPGAVSAMAAYRA
jgi:hypothetical protein